VRAKAPSSLRFAGAVHDSYMTAGGVADFARGLHGGAKDEG